MISLQHEDQTNGDGNSNLLTTSHTLCTYLYMKNTILAQPYGQPRAVSYARAYNFIRRQTICRRRGDAAAVYYGCLHLPIDVRWYIICTQTADKPHGKGKNTCQQYTGINSSEL